DIPPLNVSPIITHGQRLAVRRKGRAVDKSKLWRLKRLCRFPGPGGPDNRLAVVAAAGQQLSVPRKVNRTNAERVSNEEADGPARGDLPDLQGIGRIPSILWIANSSAESRNQIFPIGRKRQCTDGPGSVFYLEAGQLGRSRQSRQFLSGI